VKETIDFETAALVLTRLVDASVGMMPERQVSLRAICDVLEKLCPELRATWSSMGLEAKHTQIDKRGVWFALD
jgi:hypothetical protein